MKSCKNRVTGHRQVEASASETYQACRRPGSKPDLVAGMTREAVQTYGTLTLISHGILRAVVPIPDSYIFCERPRCRATDAVTELLTAENYQTVGECVMLCVTVDVNQVFIS